MLGEQDEHNEANLRIQSGQSGKKGKQALELNSPK